MGENFVKLVWFRFLLKNIKFGIRVSSSGEIV